MQWSVRPFVRLVIFYILGILAGNKLFHFDIGYVPAIVLFAFLLTGALLITKFFTSYKWRWISGFVFYLLSFFAGTYNIYFTNKAFYQQTESPENKTYVGEILSDIVFTSKAIRFEINLQSQDSIGKSNKEKVIAYFQAEDRCMNLVYGDKIILEAMPQLIKNKGNSGEFNYKSYLIHQGISRSIYLKPDNWKFLKHEPSNIIIDYARSLRRELLRRLDKRMVFNNTYEVAAAILVGYDTLMDEETEESYMNAGAMHILCVSGLHVGVIFILMTMLLKFMLKTKVTRFFRILLLLISIWAYALLTGMAPSVQRASIMFSFFVIGQGLSRPKDSYNTLAASAFVMLAINPNLLFHVGFQLSYAAVLGIISVYPSLYKMLYFKFKVVDYFWSIICVSIAAQLATFPIGTHYFHYFPNYFWITNILVIPASFAIIISGFVFFIFSWVPYVSAFLGAITSFLVWVVNGIVALVQELPFYGTEDIYMPWLKVMIIYLITILIFHLLFFRRIRLLMFLSISILILLGSNTITKYLNNIQSEFIVYNVNNQDVIQFTDGTNSYVISSEISDYNHKTYGYVLMPNNIKHGIKHEQYFRIDKPNHFENDKIFIKGNFIQFHKKRYLILSENEIYKPADSTNKLKVDMLIIAGKHKVDLGNIISTIDFGSLIISSGVPFWKRKRLIEQCKELKIKHIDIRKDGGKIYKL